MSFVYLAAILFSATGMGVLDWRYKLAFFAHARRTAILLAIGLGIFLMWDAFGIGLGIFFVGNTTLMTGLYIAPELPIEEIFFLLFLCYFTLLVWRCIELAQAARGSRV